MVWWPHAAAGPGTGLRSERRLVVVAARGRARRRPGVGLGAALAATLVSAPGTAALAATRGALAAAPGTAALAAAARGALAASRGALVAGPRVVAAEALTTAGAAGLLHLGGGHLQAGPDLLHVDLEDRALLTLAGLVGPGLEPALHDDAHAAGQRLGRVLRRLPPHRAVEEQGLLVLPLVGLTVERARRRGHGEVRDRGTRGGEAELRVGGEVADDGDRGFACHVRPPVVKRIDNGSVQRPLRGDRGNRPGGSSRTAPTVRPSRVDGAAV